MHFFKRLYNWVLSWSESRYSNLALFILAFSESIFFPIPPDVLLIALALGTPKKSFYYAANCIIGSISGAVIGYGIGHYIWLTNSGEFTSFANFFFNNIPGFTHDVYNHIKILYNQWDFWIIFTAGFTPIPYKIFTITSGVFDVNFFLFILASIIGRGTRFFLIALLIWKFGNSIKMFIDKYFNLVVFTFTILLIGGFVLIKYLL
ncbi:MAG TPA: YqaA family protein [Bacteroidales bacterium]|nr:YqaA family protein [Bacteroidales bacterium]